MGFTAKQMQALRRNLNPQHVRTRQANGRELSYIEGWYAIAEANWVFGFDSNSYLNSERCEHHAEILAGLLSQTPSS
jgi:hypothetical protein